MATSIARLVILLLVLVSTATTIQAQTASAASNATLIDAITRHGGNAVRAVTSIRMQGQSVSRGVATPIVLSADLSGSLRLDYGNPVTRSTINTPTGSKEILAGRMRLKPAHIGVFGQLDLLSVFGLKRLESSSVSWTDLGPATVEGRSVTALRADTGQSKEQYRRILRDQLEVRFDTQTGLLSGVTRTHYGENSLDVAVPVTFVFSDHRTISGIVFPFRIDVYLNTSLVETITVTNVELNPALSSGIFER
jgi:hypothetical protein